IDNSAARYDARFRAIDHGARPAEHRSREIDYRATRFETRSPLSALRRLDVPRLLTDFELMLLLAILRVGPDAYGVPVAREIEAATGRSVTRASVYAAIDRLQRMGLVTSTLGEPTAERGGRAKKILHVTADGMRAVKETRKTFITLWTGIPQLKGGT